MKPGPRGRRAVYLLPNLFTTAALFCGFYALLMTVAGKWAEAATAIFAAIVFDACDGRVARMTGTQSEFGAEYDSLSDVVAFGAAPALLMHQWCLQEIGRWGAAAAFAYCAATALRLARFNVQTGEADRRFFIGIPSPAAAALAAAFVWTLARADVDGTAGAWPVVCALLAVALAATMVSGVRYHSFKELSLRRPHLLPRRRPDYPGPGGDINAFRTSGRNGRYYLSSAHTSSPVISLASAPCGCAAAVDRRRKAKVQNRIRTKMYKLARVIGHRGLAEVAPENTLAGLRAARAAGLTFVEVDILPTADGVAVFESRRLS